MKFDDFQPLGDSDPPSNDATVAPPLEPFPEQTSAPVPANAATLSTEPPGADTPPAQPDTGRPPRLQRRLERLAARKNELSQELATLRAERDLYREQLELHRSQRNVPSAGSVADRIEPRAQGTPSWLDKSDAVLDAPPRGSAAPDFSELLARELAPVRDFIAAEKQRRQEDARRGEIHAAQTQSYAEAVEEFPELGQRGSALYRVTDQVLRSDPGLQVDPKGPYRAALIARGLLADEARAETHAQGVRQAASAINHDSGVGNGSGVDTDARTEYIQAIKAMRTSRDPEHWIKARRAAQRLSQPQ